MGYRHEKVEYRYEKSEYRHEKVGYRYEKVEYRYEKSALGNLIADSQRAEMQTDFAFTNPGGTRSNLNAGKITWGELYTVQPFNNLLMKMTLTGKQIKRVLEQQ